MTDEILKSKALPEDCSENADVIGEAEAAFFHNNGIGETVTEVAEDTESVNGSDGDETNEVNGDSENAAESENGDSVGGEERPTAILFAGVNGAGKTSLYQVMSRTEPLGERISIDDIVKENGSWRDYILQIKAAKLAIDRMQKCIKARISYHHETTLPGKIVYKQLERSRAAGYRILLYYVGIDGIDTAIERVHRRVERGGHGIDDRAIIQRYNNMPANLRRILPLCDEAYFFDNTVRFRQIAIHRGGEILDEDPILPNWYQSIFTGHAIPDPFKE